MVYEIPVWFWVLFMGAVITVLWACRSRLDN